jgi:hypothetical protein
VGFQPAMPASVPAFFLAGASLRSVGQDAILDAILRAGCQPALLAFVIILSRGTNWDAEITLW